LKKETSGIKLKQNLGLSHLKYVSFIRIIGLPSRTIAVFYDSRRSNIPLTTQRVLKNYNLFSARLFPHSRELLHSPLIPIEEYNGQTQDLFIISIDISGIYGNEKNQQIRESKKLNEWVTLAALASSDAMSNFTKRTRKQRNTAVKAENYTAKPIDCELNDDGSVLFIFETTATTPIYPDDYEFGQVNPENNFAIEKNPDKKYTIYIKILDFMKWLKETRPDYLETKKITWKEIRDVLEVAYIQVFSTSPSFHWQGISYWLSQLDGSLYPTDIKPKFWNRDDLHGDGNAFVDKHLGGLLRSFKFFYNPMASMIQKRMKDKGLL
jgi:hypothetical protein